MTKEPDLGDMLYSFWRARLFLLAGAVIGVAVALGLVMIAVPHYKATMLLGAPERMNITDGQINVPAYSRYQAAPGLQGETAQIADFVRFEYIVRGAAVAKILLEDAVVREGVRLDRRFVLEQNHEDVLADPAALAAYLKRHVKIEPVGLTNLRRLVYTHPDPDFAAYMLTALHRAADQLIRDDVARRTTQRANWLNDMLGQISHPDHQKALVGLLMMQEQARMLVAMEEPFAAAVIEESATEDKPYWPRRSLFILGGVLAGLVLGYAVYGLRRAARTRLDPDA